MHWRRSILIQYEEIGDYNGLLEMLTGSTCASEMGMASVITITMLNNEPACGGAATCEQTPIHARDNLTSLRSTK